MSITTRVRSGNPYAFAYDMFLKQTSEHWLHVLHEDGLYRHLRVQAPGTRIWAWDVITWPGHLATAGDVADGYTFARLPDMLNFFSVPEHLRGYHDDGAPCIDLHYWAGKLCGDRSREVKVYDPQTFMRQVHEDLNRHEGLSTHTVTMAQLLEDARHNSASEIEAFTWLERNRGIFGPDTWEWDLREYDVQFQITCYALELTTRLWHTQQR